MSSSSSSDLSLVQYHSDAKQSPYSDDCYNDDGDCYYDSSSISIKVPSDEKYPNVTEQSSNVILQIDGNCSVISENISISPIINQ